MKKLLSHTKTKMELADYLAQKTIEDGVHNRRRVCQLYLPKTEMSSVSEVRSCLFQKKQAQSERLPTTQAALLQAISRAHHQALVWNNDVVAKTTLPSPENYRWELHGELVRQS